MNPNEWTFLLTGLIGGGGVTTIGVKWMSRRGDNATAEQALAAARQTDIDTLRQIITEVRASEALKSQELEQIKGRLDRLEERERHMLTRAAVHEAWDQMAFAALLSHNPAHPPPPPLAITEGDDDPL